VEKSTQKNNTAGDWADAVQKFPGKIMSKELTEKKSAQKNDSMTSKR